LTGQFSSFFGCSDLGRTDPLRRGGADRDVGNWRRAFSSVKQRRLHLQKVAGGRQCLLDGGKAGGAGVLGRRKRGQAVGRVLACAMELALQILLGDLEIAHGHGDVIVTQQLHESGKTDPEMEAFLWRRCGEDGEGWTGVEQPARVAALAKVSKRR